MHGLEKLILNWSKVDDSLCNNLAQKLSQEKEWHGDLIVTDSLESVILCTKNNV